MPPLTQNPRMKIPEPQVFREKELRQIEHFLNREMGEDYYWNVDKQCNCGDCPKVSENVQAYDALKHSEVYKKFVAMAKKYDLHITIERDTGRIWATKKGISSGKVSSV